MEGLLQIEHWVAGPVREGEPVDVGLVGSNFSQLEGRVAEHREQMGHAGILVAVVVVVLVCVE